MTIHRAHRTVLLAVLSAVLGLLAAPSARANVIACGPSIAPGTICLEGNVLDGQDGPLIPGQVYVVTNSITVPVGQTLTADGAILKFGNNAHLSVSGTLSAVGTTFTSIHDDVIGGDTNTNGGMTHPAAGDWDFVLCGPGADASIFDGAVFAFAGAGLSLNAADVLVQNSQFRDLQLFGVNAQGSSLPVVTGCTFLRCGNPIVNARLLGVPLFIGNTAQGCTMTNSISTLDGVISANTVIGPQNATNDDGVFIISNNTGTTVDPGVTLTLQPGVVFKFGNGPTIQTITVNGTLDADSVAFTSIHDDTIGGDTNLNGNATAPAPGDWRTMTFHADSDASVLRNALVRYGGNAVSVAGGPTILLNAADVTLDGVVLQGCKNGGVDLKSPAQSFPTVTGCSFLQNGGWPVRDLQFENLVGFSNNAAVGNSSGDVLLMEDANVTGNVVLDFDQTFNGSGVVVHGRNVLEVTAGASLTVPPGFVFKMQTGQHVEVRGTLSCAGTTFTSYLDDTVGGDTNLDGSATLPAPGEWDGIVFEPGSSASVLDQVTVRYTGRSLGNASAALEMRFGASPTFSNVFVDFGKAAAMDLNNTCFPQVRDCTFLNNERAVTAVPIAAVAGFTNNDASGNAQGDYLEISQGTVSATEGVGCISVSPANALNQDGVFVVTAGIDVQQGACLVIDGGCILKIAHSGAVTVNGTLVAGASGTPTFFTRVEDDSIGGDTTKDGGASSPDPGDWIGLVFNSTSTACAFDDVVVRYAGRLGASVRLVGGVTPGFADTVIRDGQGSAMLLQFGARPSVVNCSFLDCDLAVAGASINAVPGFVDNVASGNTNGDYLQIVGSSVSGDVLVGRKNALNGEAFVVVGNVAVPTGAKLTLEGGTVFKWNGGFGLTVDGTFWIPSSNAVPAVFTSVHDDAVVGDTTKNGNATAPAPGDWTQVRFNAGSDASIVSGLIVDYAGRLSAPSVLLTNADILFLDAIVRRGLGDGMDLSGNSFPQVRRSRFDDNGGTAVDGVPLGAIAGFEDNTANGNALFDALRVTNGSSPLTGGPGPEGAGTEPAVEVRVDNSLNRDGIFALAYDPFIAAGDRVVLNPGVILKLVNASTVTVNGALDLLGTGFRPVVLTTIRDDLGGDTNKDGAATVPSPGDWRGIVYQGGATPSRAAHATLRFAGSGLTPALRSFSATTGLELFAVRVENALGDGFRLGGLAGDAMNLVAFQNGGDGIELTGGAFDVLFATAAQNAGTGILAQTGHAGGLSSSIAFGNATAQAAGFAAGEVFFSNAGSTYAGSNGNVEADPLFVDPANGDLRLAAGSPSLNAGEFSKALLARVDRDERSRALDHDLSGAMLPDMGAYERAVYELSVSGDPFPGSVLAFTVNGPPGTATFELGDGQGLEILDPLGFLTVGTDRATLQVLPVGQTLHFPVPAGFAFPAGGFAVQATARSDADPARGNVTERYRASPDPAPANAGAPDVSAGRPRRRGP